ncbi:MAG: DivIVA domain-containing protein [Desulfosarcina sp.]|nr:DivIVA domain-containing protein [Desulfobacterales bacterium]
MKTTPIDIQQQQFKVKFRGFDIHEVDSFLEEMADTFEVMQHQIENFNDKIHRLERENQGYKEREETFKRAMLNSQKVLEQIQDNANKSAEIIIADAEVKAEKILNRAHNRLSQLHEDITELKRQRMQIEVQIRSIIETHTKLLDMGKEETKILDDVDSKVKLLKHTDQF